MLLLKVGLLCFIILMSFTNRVAGEELDDQANMEDNYQRIRNIREIDEVYRSIRRLIEWYHLKLSEDQLVELKLIIVELREYAKTRSLNEMRSLILHKIKSFAFMIDEQQYQNIKRLSKSKLANDQNELSFTDMTGITNAFTTIKRWMKANYDTTHIMDLMMKMFIIKSAVEHGDLASGYKALLQMVDLFTDYPEAYARNFQESSDVTMSDKSFSSVETTE